jgi:hypothetical protein
MDCPIPSCKCVCHNKYPQEINIKQLMIEQLEKENEDDLIMMGQNDLWERRRQLHSAQKSEKEQQINELEPVQESEELIHDSTNPSIYNPVPLNRLHKYKIKERDKIIRDIYGKAYLNIKIQHDKLDTKSKKFNELVGKEADRLLSIWLNEN